MAAPLSFFARPPVLGEAKTVPALTNPKRVASNGVNATGESSKRVKPNPSISVNAHAVKLKKPKTAVVEFPRTLTPVASSDPIDVDSRSHLTLPRVSGFYEDLKINNPAMDRIRAAPPTPTTSTVAASSSPGRRFALSSSPRSSNRMKASSTPVFLDASTTLIFGRHRHAPTGPSAPPASLIPRLHSPANLARTICLDRAARHASRVHAAAELVQTEWGHIVRLIVLGQNGVRVKHAGSRRRLLQGTVTEFAADESLEVDFYGAAVRIRTDERERLFTPEPQMAREVSPMSLPPSSPPMLMDHFDHSDHMDEDEPMVSSAPTPAAVSMFSRSSSPLSEPEDNEPVVINATGAPTPAPAAIIAGSAPTPRFSSPVPRAMPASSPSPNLSASTPAPRSRAGTPRPPKSRPATPPVEIPPFPAGLDLPALLASTVVFSGSSKLSLPDLVKSLLEAQPSLRDHGADSVWSVWCSEELNSNPMFGKVARNGRDRSGQPLLPHYFYNPAADPDTSRAQELGGLVRPLRAAQRTGGKVIDWRPVGSGRRRY